MENVAYILSKLRNMHWYSFLNPIVHYYIFTLNKFLTNNFNDLNLTRFNFISLYKLLQFAAERARPEEVSDVAIELLHDGDVFYDIGGNLSLVSLNILKKRDVKIIIFEPVPIYRDFSRLATAGYSKVEIIGKALSDKEGTEILHMCHDNLGWNTLIKEKITHGMVPINVETTTLDAYWRNSGRPVVHLLKIDVEGA